MAWRILKPASRTLGSELKRLKIGCRKRYIGRPMTSVMPMKARVVALRIAFSRALFPAA
jgi:hypothetical protein